MMSKFLAILFCYTILYGSGFYAMVCGWGLSVKDWGPVILSYIVALIFPALIGFISKG